MPKVSKNSKKNLRNLRRKMIGGVSIKDPKFADETISVSLIEDFKNSGFAKTKEGFQNFIKLKTPKFYIYLSAYKELMNMGINIIHDPHDKTGKHSTCIDNPIGRMVPQKVLEKLDLSQSLAKRSEVNKSKVSWHIDYPDYNPTENPDSKEFGIDITQYKDSDYSKGLPDYSDKPDPTYESDPKSGRWPFRHSLLGYIIIDDDTGLPLNPMGRTGFKGRGVLGNWGCNFAADPIVMWIKDDKLYIVLIMRNGDKQLAIPGGMVEAGEDVSLTCYKEFLEECGGTGDVTEEMVFTPEQMHPKIKQPLQIIKLEKVLSSKNPKFLKAAQELFGIGGRTSQSLPVFEGYIDDRRNTDNCWMESNAKLFFIPPSNTAIISQLSNSELYKEGEEGKARPVEITVKNFEKSLIPFASHFNLVLDAVKVLGDNMSQFKLSDKAIKLITDLCLKYEYEIAPATPAPTAPAGQSCSGQKTVTLDQIATFITGEDANLGEIGQKYACVTGNTVTTPFKKNQVIGGKKSHKRSSVAHKKSTTSHKSVVAKLFQASTKNRSKIPAKKSLKMVKVRSGRKA